MKLFSQLFHSRPTVESRLSSLEDAVEHMDRQLNIMAANIATMQHDHEELTKQRNSIVLELRNLKNEVPVSFIGELKT